MLDVRRNILVFTIMIGLFFGGIMVDRICEPFMAANSSNTLLTTLFGSGKGSGAALMMFILGAAGAAWCLINGKNLRKYEYKDS